MGTSTEEPEVGNGGQGLSFVVFGFFFYSNKNVSIMYIIETEWLRNFETLRLFIESDHKFSGSERSKPGTSRELCVTNVT